jgi:hypothetical protein
VAFKVGDLVAARPNYEREHQQPWAAARIIEADGSNVPYHVQFFDRSKWHKFYGTKWSVAEGVRALTDDDDDLWVEIARCTLLGDG